MKRLSVLLLVLAMVFTVVACGNGNVTDNTTKKADTTTKISSLGGETTKAKVSKLGVILSQGGLGDLGYNDNAQKGLIEAKQLYGIEYIMVDPVDLTQSETYARELADAGCDAILSFEFSFKDTIRSVASEYPDVVFIIQGKYTDDKPVPANIVIEDYYNNQSNFCAGVLASFLATDGNSIVAGVGEQPGAVVGMIMGTESAGFQRNSDAFMCGAEFYNPDCKVLLDFTCGFTDTSNCKNITTNMFQNGADVVYTCTGAAGLGGLAACAENKIYGIGVDSNQDYLQPGIIASSVMKHTDKTCLMVAERLVNGTLYGSSIVDTVYNGGVGLTDMATMAKYVTNKENFAKLQEVLADVIKGIEDGTIEAFDTYDKKNQGVRYVNWKATKGSELPNYADWKSKHK